MAQMSGRHLWTTSFVNDRQLLRKFATELKNNQELLVLRQKRLHCAQGNLPRAHDTQTGHRMNKAGSQEDEGNHLRTPPECTKHRPLRQRESQTTCGIRHVQTDLRCHKRRALKEATWNERAGIAGPSLIGFPPPNRVGSVVELAPTAGTMQSAMPECYTRVHAFSAKNDGGISRDCNSDDDWKWKQEEAGGGRRGCTGDDCNASRIYPPHNLVMGLRFATRTGRTKKALIQSANAGSCMGFAEPAAPQKDGVVGWHLQIGDNQEWRKVTDVVGRHH